MSVLVVGQLTWAVAKATRGAPLSLSVEVFCTPGKDNMDMKKAVVRTLDVLESEIQ